jgi:hypothetical protein
LGGSEDALSLFLVLPKLMPVTIGHGNEKNNDVFERHAGYQNKKTPRKILDNNGLILYILYSFPSGCFLCLIP